MKTYIARYCRHGGWGYQHDISTVVVESCESAALGLLLMSYGTTDAADWTLEEIDTRAPNVVHIEEHEHC